MSESAFALDKRRHVRFNPSYSPESRLSAPHYVTTIAAAR